MKAQTLIDQLKTATYLAEVLEPPDFHKQFKEAAKVLHPDVCALPDAASAFSRLVDLKDIHEKGQDFDDDAGKVEARHLLIHFRGEAEFLDTSWQNFQRLKKLPGKSAQHFFKYLPTAGKRSKTDLSFSLPQRSVPLSGLVLPEGQVTWILSRLLEVSAWLAQEGLVHGGINPESVFVVPEMHGVVLTSFYHLSLRGQKMKSVSGRYKNWYPDELFAHKTADSFIDLECCKRLAAYLLGDASGSGVKLQKKVNPALLKFLLDRHVEAYTCYDQYRQMLGKNFPKAYVPLHL
jgi:serine/threonine protein kinase